MNSTAFNFVALSKNQIASSTPGNSNASFPTLFLSARLSFLVGYFYPLLQLIFSPFSGKPYPGLSLILLSARTQSRPTLLLCVPRFFLTLLTNLFQPTRHTFILGVNSRIQKKSPPTTPTNLELFSVFPCAIRVVDKGGFFRNPQTNLLRIYCRDVGGLNLNSELFQYLLRDKLIRIP